MSWGALADAPVPSNELLHKGYFVGRDEGDPPIEQIQGYQLEISYDAEVQCQPVTCTVNTVTSPAREISYDTVNVDDDKINELVLSVQSVFHSLSIDKSQVRKVIVDAYKSTDNIFGVNDAIAWGTGFSWPQRVFTRDTSRARDYGYNLTLMTANHQHSMAHDRLSSDRITEWVDPQDPAYHILMDLVKGMRLFTDTKFKPNNSPPPKRKLYLQVSNAVNKGFLDAWEDELVFIFPKNIMYRFGDIHYSPVHWTTKVGKECGRTLFDSSDDKHGCPLNTDAVRDKVRDYYGDIHHPTL